MSDLPDDIEILKQIVIEQLCLEQAA